MTNPLAFTLITGIGATLAMDGWSIARRAWFGIPAADYGLVGRWFAHMAVRRRFRHDAIAKAEPMRGERLVGWIAHYAIGIAFAALPLAAWGDEWMRQPTLGAGLAVGIATVAAPFFVMQPALGAGIAASRTPRPGAARMQSLITHAVFGLGLYAAGRAAALLWPA